MNVWEYSIIEENETTLMGKIEISDITETAHYYEITNIRKMAHMYFMLPKRVAPNAPAGKYVDTHEVTFFQVERAGKSRSASATRQTEKARGSNSIDEQSSRAAEYCINSL